MTNIVKITLTIAAIVLTLLVWVVRQSPTLLIKKKNRNCGNISMTEEQELLPKKSSS